MDMSRAGRNIYKGPNPMDRMDMSSIVWEAQSRYETLWWAEAEI
jgi:hypothetical protein